MSPTNKIIIDTSKQFQTCFSCKYTIQSYRYDAHNTLIYIHDFLLNSVYSPNALHSDHHFSYKEKRLHLTYEFYQLIYDLQIRKYNIQMMIMFYFLAICIVYYKSIRQGFQIVLSMLYRSTHS